MRTNNIKKLRNNFLFGPKKSNKTSNKNTLIINNSNKDYIKLIDCFKQKRTLKKLTS